MLTKSQEKRIQDIIRLVHEKRLTDALTEVENALKDWREGALPIMKVDAVIRAHLQKSTRLFARYANVAARDLEALSVLDEAKLLSIIDGTEYHQLTEVSNATLPKKSEDR